jgi:hypothetical protein
VDADGAGGDDTAYLEALFGFGDGVSDDDVVDPVRVKLGYGGQQTFDDGDGEVIGAVEPEFTSFGFSDGGTIAGDDVCFLHENIF